MQVGQRVQIPAHTDAWMRGDRYGAVAEVNGSGVIVQMDKSERRYAFGADEVTPV